MAIAEKYDGLGLSLHEEARVVAARDGDHYVIDATTTSSTAPSASPPTRRISACSACSRALRPRRPV
ncbi:hypothetical protein [Reyranella sp.]|uniref:hypothetical protein n=1 Tax=Reyranella sp. TaxID=1929291 RepID=UPI003D0B0709